MEYEVFCSLLENVPGQTQKIQAYDIIEAISEYIRPALPWTAIMQIRHKGYVANNKLHEVLTREGFTSLSFSQQEAAYITQYRKARWRNARTIHPYVANIHSAGDWTKRYAKLFLLEWRTGSVLKTNRRQYGVKPIAQQTILSIDPVPKVKRKAGIATTSTSVAEKSIAWVDQTRKLYSGWTTPQQVKAAQQHFLTQNPDFRIATDQEIVDIITLHLIEHRIPHDTTIKALADIVTRNLKLIRKDARAHKDKFDIFVTSDQIHHMFLRKTGKSFAAHRDRYGEPVKVSRSWPLHL